MPSHSRKRRPRRLEPLSPLDEEELHVPSSEWKSGNEDAQSTDSSIFGYVHHTNVTYSADLTLC